MLAWLRTGAAVCGYFLRFVPAVLRRHSLVLPSPLPVLHQTAALTPGRVRDWRSFFEYDGPSMVPFTYFTAENSRLLFELLGGFGLNFRNLLLVQHDFVAGSGLEAVLAAEGDYTLHVTVEEIRVLPRNRVLLACRCVARRREDGAVTFETCDRFLVKDIPADAHQALANREGVVHGAGAEPVAARLDSESPSTFEETLRIPMNAGVRFGLLSGDLNVVHAHPRVARLFGHRHPFVQGLYTSNAAMAALARRMGRAPRRWSIRFCRPLFLGQEATLRFAADAFEVIDAKGSCAAAGVYAV